MANPAVTSAVREQLLALDRSAKATLAENERVLAEISRRHSTR